jgi:hypothetical protein
MDIKNRLVGASCSLPNMTLDELLQTYQSMGFTRFEGYSEWSASKIDFHGAPEQH